MSNITTSDLKEFLEMVEKNKDQYDSFNVAMVNTVLGTFLMFIEAKKTVTGSTDKQPNYIGKTYVGPAFYGSREYTVVEQLTNIAAVKDKETGEIKWVSLKSLEHNLKETLE